MPKGHLNKENYVPFENVWATRYCYLDKNFR